MLLGAMNLPHCLVAKVLVNCLHLSARDLPADSVPAGVKNEEN